MSELSVNACKSESLPICRYGMPLFQIVGRTATNQTFTAAFAYMKQETTEFYKIVLQGLAALHNGCQLVRTWVTDGNAGLINALGQVFPRAHRVRCYWHIDKAIVRNLKGCFATNLGFDIFKANWKAWVVDAPTVEMLQIGIDKIHRVHPGRVSAYLDGVLQDKEHFCKAYLSSTPHFGELNSSRVEGAHRRLKLKAKGTHDLLESAKRILQYMDEQQAAIFHKTASTRWLAPIFPQETPFFQHIRCKVTDDIQHLLLQQWHIADKARRLGHQLGPCTRTHRQTLGLPCAHEMQTRRNQGDILHMADIDHLVSHAPTSFIKLMHVPSVSSAHTR